MTESQNSSDRRRSAGKAPFWPSPAPVSAPHDARLSEAIVTWRCPAWRSVSSEALGTQERLREVRDGRGPAALPSRHSSARRAPSVSLGQSATDSAASAPASSSCIVPAVKSRRLAWVGGWVG